MAALARGLEEVPSDESGTPSDQNPHPRPPLVMLSTLRSGDLARRTARPGTPAAHYRGCWRTVRPPLPLEAESGSPASRLGRRRIRSNRRARTTSVRKNRMKREFWVTLLVPLPRGSNRYPTSTTRRPRFITRRKRRSLYPRHSAGSGRNTSWRKAKKPDTGSLTDRASERNTFAVHSAPREIASRTPVRGPAVPPGA